MHGGSLRILVVLLWLRIFASWDVQQQPMSIGGKSRRIIKPLVATGVIAGLFIGKKVIDGPSFNEPVSMRNRNVVITGANSGLGRATAETMAKLGANVFLLCKSADKGNAAAKEIRDKTGNSNVESLTMDLLSLQSIQKATSDIKNRLDNIHVLINNAGVMALPKRAVTEDGFEAHMGINHLGHFALTGQLMDLLLKEDPNDSVAKRIVNVASAAHYFGRIDKDNLMLDRPGSYDPWSAYGNSKQANILFTTELAKKLEVVNSQRTVPIIAACCHPGVCRTELGRYAFDMSQLPAYLNPILSIALSPACKSSHKHFLFSSMYLTLFLF